MSDFFVHGWQERETKQIQRHVPSLLKEESQAPDRPVMSDTLTVHCCAQTHIRPTFLETQLPSGTTLFLTGISEHFTAAGKRQQSSVSQRRTLKFSRNTDVRAALWTDAKSSAPKLQQFLKVNHRGPWITVYRSAWLELRLCCWIKAKLIITFILIRSCLNMPSTCV